MYFYQEGVGLASELSLELCSGIYSYSVPLSILIFDAECDIQCG